MAAGDSLPGRRESAASVEGLDGDGLGRAAGSGSPDEGAADRT